MERELTKEEIEKVCKEVLSENPELDNFPEIGKMWNITTPDGMSMSILYTEGVAREFDKAMKESIKGLEIKKDVKVFDVKFRGIDDWNRPVYKQVDKKVYFGSTCVLFPDKSIAPNNDPKEINAYFRTNPSKLELFGDHFNCEPHGGNSPKWVFNIID